MMLLLDEGELFLAFFFHESRATTSGEDGQRKLVG